MFSNNGTGSFTLKLGESFVLVKLIFGFTLFGSNRLSCFSRDLINEQPFSPAYGKMSVRLLVIPFSFCLFLANTHLVYLTFPLNL